MTKNAYARSGVDVDAGDKAVELMKQSVKATLVPQVLQGAGGFAGMFDISTAKGMKRPVLATSTDGVGTKVDIARQMGIYDTIGFDLVGMVVDDIAVTGARPLFMTDYISCGKLFPERIAEIVKGIANACQVAKTALVGGETAEHPGLLAEDEFDVAGAAVGIIDAEDVLGPEKVQVGDKIVALASSGLHSNGFSLVRRIFTDSGMRYSDPLHEFDGTPSLGELLLTPTRVYSEICLQLADECDVHGFSHVTGGGIASNLARVLPHGSLGMVQRSSWQMPQVFEFIKRVGHLEQIDLDETLNIGVGMLVILPENSADKAIRIAKSAKIDAWVCGEVVADTGDLNAVRDTKGVQGGGAMII